MTDKYTRRAALGVLCGMVMAASVHVTAGLAQGLSVKHSRGQLTLKSMPKKVIVFDLAALDTLDTLGVEVMGVAGSLFPSYLAKYESNNSIKVGSLFEPNYEAVHAAAPDLIITGGRSSSQYKALAKIAPTINLDSDDRNYVASSIRNIETLAILFGKQDVAAQHIAKLKASMAELKALTPKAGRGLIVLTTGGLMSAYGPGSRFGVLHDDFGVVPAAAKLRTALHGEPISHEFILKTNPDWLFVVDRDAAIGQSGQAAAQFLDNELVRRTTAWKTGQVVYLDPSDWYMVGGGLTSLQRKVDQVSAALKGKLPR